MIQVQTFGAVELRRDQTEVRSVLSQPKRMALLVHLLLGSPSGFLNRDAVLARFWPDADTDRARNSLRQALHQLRRSLGDDVIENRGDEIGCRTGTIVCDALEFERAIAAGRLDEAMQHYRGEFLPAFYVEDAPAVEAWIEERRGYLRRQAFRVAGALADHEVAGGQLKAAVLWARQAAAIEPYDEESARRLIRLLAQGGEAAAALAAFDEFETRLRAEHDIEPSVETRRLAESIRSDASRPAVVTHEAVPPTAPSLPTSPGAQTDPPSSTAPLPVVPQGTAPVGPPDAAAVRAPAGPADPHPARRRLPLQLAAASLVLLVGVAGWQVRSLRAGPETAPAIAVLPFVNMSGDAANDYLSDGMAEELLSVLTRVPGITVAARTSSFSFKGKDVQVDSVARALGVTHVVEGSVRVSGERLRIAVQLIEAATGFHLWSESYDRDTRDIIAVQDEISRAIAKSLQVRLSPAVARPSQSETRDPEAYRLLLQATQIMRSGSTRANLAEAAPLLEEALRRDPDYPRAMAALANVLSWQANYRHINADTGYARARALAERALVLAPTVEAHLVLARDAEFQQWDTAAADGHYRAALEIDPQDPRAHQFRALFLGRSGRVDEGIAAARRAVELDPLHPGAHNNLAVVLRQADRLDEAREAYLAALRVSPEDPIILENLANLMARQERWDDAIAYLDRALAQMPDDMQTLALRTSILLRSGQLEAGMAMLEQLEARPDIPRFRLAILYSNVNDVEKILDLLEQSVERREDGVLGIRSPEMFRGMREHPRFVKLLESIGP
jgi:adenylate cyclase